MELLLADDHVLFKEALTLFFEAARPQWNVKSTANITETMSLLAENTYDLVLLDLRMPGMSSMGGIRSIKRQHPEQPIAILSGVAEDYHIKEAISLGIKAYLPKTLSGMALIKAIELVVISKQSFIPLDKDGLQIMPSYYDDYSGNLIKRLPLGREDTKKAILKILTKREKEVMYFIALGLSNKEIAHNMNLQTSTVKIYVAKLCKKLEVDNRTQIAITCHQLDLTTNSIE